MQTETPQSTPAQPKRGLATRSLGAFWSARDNADKAHPLKRTVLAVIFLTLGVAGSEAYQWMREKLIGPDEYLEQMKRDQETAFARLEDGLRQIRGSVDSGARDAVREISGAVGEMRSINSSLISQLALAKQENDRLSKIAQQRTGVSGGYDFILSENTGLRIDPTTQIGVGSISGRGARVRLSAESADNAQTFLQTGEFLAYRGADGRSCKVTLLSVTDNGSASFALSCPDVAGT